MTLDELNPGDKGTIKKLSIKDKLGQRLMDMGIYPGLTLNVVWNAP
ncbi:FeoA family protein [Desulfobacter postgatei]|jgi:ferrous iron transport protein A|nr:FeoA family protein [Desulfobacter postgatei]MDX9963519.1 FeoA family protein [Desulfobacter postgatei]